MLYDAMDFTYILYSTYYIYIVYIYIYRIYTTILVLFCYSATCMWGFYSYRLVGVGKIHQVTLPLRPFVS